LTNHPTWLYQGEREFALPLLKDAFMERFPGTKIIPAIETEIKSIIHFLKQKKSPVYNEITRTF
jgi:hypothetical protein